MNEVKAWKNWQMWLCWLFNSLGLSLLYSDDISYSFLIQSFPNRKIAKHKDWIFIQHTVWMKHTTMSSKECENVSKWSKIRFALNYRWNTSVKQSLMHRVSILYQYNRNVERKCRNWIELFIRFSIIRNIVMFHTTIVNFWTLTI